MRFLKSAGIMLSVLGLGASVHAAILDQDGWDTSGRSDSLQGVLGQTSGEFILAQTFTAGASGWLDSVAVQVAHASNNVPTGPLAIGIYGVTGSGAADINQPLGAAVNVPLSQVPEVEMENANVVADFRPTHFAITAGQQYALVLSMPATFDGKQTSGAYMWGANDQDSYPGGSAYLFNSSFTSNFVTYPSLGSTIRDLNFRTYYYVPEPASLALLGLGGLILLGGRRMRESRRVRLADQFA